MTWISRLLPLASCGRWRRRDTRLTAWAAACGTPCLAGCRRTGTSPPPPGQRRPWPSSVPTPCPQGSATEPSPSAAPGAPRRSPRSAGTGTIPTTAARRASPLRLPWRRIWPGGISPLTPWPSPCGGSCGTPSAGGRIWKSGVSAAWESRRGALGRTPCASSGGSASRRCWISPSSRRPPPPSRRRGGISPSSRRNGS